MLPSRLTTCAVDSPHFPVGLLVPDIPLEETYAVREVCDKHGIELVLLATPTTPVERMTRIAKASQVG